MLTVKHAEDGGRETIYTCFKAELRPCEETVRGLKRRRVLAMTEDGYVVAEIDDGHVFIMNEQGRTVQQYNLRGDDSPKAA